MLLWRHAYHHAADTSLLTVSLLLEELKEVTDWYMLGAYLNVPVHELKKINPQDGVERCKLEVLQFWLNTTISASWQHIARALELLDMLTLAARLKSKYLCTSGVCLCVCACVCVYVSVSV